jgi:hypothetical protein
VSLSRLLQLVAGALVLGLLGWAAWGLSAPWRGLQAARARWAAAAVGHYRLAVEQRGWGGCGQEAEIRAEQIVAIARNGCRFASPRAVSDLFAEVERLLAPPEVGLVCRRGLPGRGCACYAPYQVQVVYNRQRGYPEEIVARLGTYAPNPMHLDYWRALIRQGRQPYCGGPLEPGGVHLIVARFQPLP